MALIGKTNTFSKKQEKRPDVDDCLHIDDQELVIEKDRSTSESTVYSAKLNVAVRFDTQLNQKSISLLMGINHNNIVRFFGIIDTPTSYGYVIELCGRGPLFDYIHRSGKDLKLTQAIMLSEGIVNGVRYLHKDAPGAPIKHNNLTSHEIVLKDIKGVLIPKITGFDYAKQHIPAQQTTHKPALSALQSPERINGGRSSPESDIYSVGIIMCEMLSKEIPFGDKKGLEALNFVCEGGRPNIPSGPEFEKMKRVIERCWEQDPNDRPTAMEVHCQLKEMIKGDVCQKETLPPPPQVSLSHGNLPRIEGANMGDVLGKGCIGTTNNAVHDHEKHRDVVLKSLKLQYSDDFQKYEEILCRIGTHDNIVKVFGRTKTHIVMEKMPFSLETYLAQQSIADKAIFLKVARGVANGLEHLHSLTPAVIHGRIHPRNVFLDSEMNAKISDAGYFYLDRNAGLSATHGMEAYQSYEASPHSYQCMYYEPGADIFSFGVLLIEMWTLERVPNKGNRDAYNNALEKIRTSWLELYKVVKKYTKPGQEGMYKRRNLTMDDILKDLKKLK